MQNETKKGIWQRLFGEKTACCSFEIEEAEISGPKLSREPDDLPPCCSSPLQPGANKSPDSGG